MSGIYHPSGAMRITVVNGLTPVGASAADGSRNGVIVDGFEPHPGYQSGRYYPTYPGIAGGGAAVTAADTLYVYQARLLLPVTITHLALRTATGGAGSSAKVAVWNDVGGRPVGAPVIANNTGGATTGNNTTVDLAAAITLESGWYWFGTKFTGTLPTMLAITAVARNDYYYGFDTISGTGTVGLSVASTYSDNMPTLTGSESWTHVISNAGTPIVFLKVA